MTIKIKLKDAILISQGLSELPKLPSSAIKAAYWLGRIRDYIQSSLEQYDKNNTENIKECGELNEDTGRYEVKGDKLQAYQDANEALLGIEIEIPFDKVKLKDIMGTNVDKQPELSADMMFKCFKIIDGEGVV